MRFSFFGAHPVCRCFSYQFQGPGYCYNQPRVASGGGATRTSWRRNDANFFRLKFGTSSMHMSMSNGVEVPVFGTFVPPFFLGHFHVGWKPPKKSVHKNQSK